MNKALTAKYRPQTFDEVVGHEVEVRALKGAIKADRARTFLFTGGSGFGKTTLARIAAREIGCLEQDFLEVDAATKTGIAEMREVMDSVQYRPLGEGTIKAVLIDEVHALSKAAVQSLLKITEDPPDWVYWFLATTEPKRVIKTLRTRSFALDLKPVSSKIILGLLERIAKKEKLADGPHGQKLLSLCADMAEGSPRQAISNLAVCAEAKSLKEAEGLLEAAADEAEAIDLARLLVKRAKWHEVQEVLGRLKEGNAESVRHVVRAYLTTVALNARDVDTAGATLEMLDCFLTPFHPSDGHSPLVLACGKALLS